MVNSNADMHQDDILVSIITVCKNAETTIIRCVKSVREQSYKNIQHVIVDGQSTDNTLRLIESSIGDNTVVLSEMDKSLYEALNKGVNLSRGQVVGILNSDDVFTDKTVVATIVKILKETEVDGVYGNVLYLNDKGSPIRYYRSYKLSLLSMKLGIMPAHPATFVKRYVYESGYMYNASYKIAADYDWFLRLLLFSDYSFKKINLLAVNMSNGGISNRSIMNRNIVNKEIVKSLEHQGICSILIKIRMRYLFKIFDYIMAKYVKY
jgi:glycosyltransferase involved in cell wall biosynthesis